LKRVNLLYEDENCLIFNKPAGLAVQGGKGVKVSLDSLLALEYTPRPLLVHRLDQDTSGIILVAKNREAAAFLSPLLAKKGIMKQYRAICAGKPQEASGVICGELEKRGREQSAVTRYSVIAGGDDFSLLELELGTGRMHQIRRHLAGLGNPVLGDDKYGDFRLNRELKKTMGLKRLLLHAWRLIIPASQPFFTKDLDISEPPPDYFRPFYERLGINTLY
jgi:23S rRNA pseudouridine955/2504/2580 synthase